jgi:tetratricopeptide (TPR) repeat protein
MGRFNRLLMCLALLASAGTLRAQQPSATNPSAANPSAVNRVPAPSEKATAVELEEQADSYRMQKAYLDAIDYYRAALKKSNTAVLHNKVGICFLLLLRDKEARKEFQHSMRLDKNYPEAYNNLGALYYNSKKYGPAISEYKKAIKLNDGNASFHSNLGTAYFSEKNMDLATREYTRAIQIDPGIFERQPSGGVAVKLVTSTDLARFHYLMAQMYCQNGNLERCRYYLSKANEEGYHIIDALKDKEFSDLNKDPNFIAFVRSLKAPSDANQ